MVTRAILALALLLPVAAHAEDMLKWRDARGRLHYSNDTEKAPSGAQPVTRQIGEIGGAPIGEAVAAPEGARAARAEFPGGEGCVRALGLDALPHRAVDLDRRAWFQIDQGCGRQTDIESWLRDASTTLELRKIGL